MHSERFADTTLAQLLDMHRTLSCDETGEEFRAVQKEIAARAKADLTDKNEALDELIARRDQRKRVLKVPLCSHTKTRADIATIQKDIDARLRVPIAELDRVQASLRRKHAWHEERLRAATADAANTRKALNEVQKEISLRSRRPLRGQAETNLQGKT